MLTISTLLNNFRTLNTDTIIRESLEETKPDFIKSNKDQLKGGITNDDKRIAPRYRSKGYADYKEGLNPLPGNGIPDLFVTGAFYEGIDETVETDSLKIFSTDEKGPQLEEKYKNIFGLGKNFKNQYLTHSLRPTVMSKISDFTGLKFN